MLDLKALLAEEKNLGKKPYIVYKVSLLKEIDDEIISIKKVETKENIRQDAIELEYTNPDSIVLMFVAGRINLLINPHESQVRLTNLMNSFYDNRNFECAEFVAQIITKDVDSPVALRVLGDIAKNRGEEDKMWDYYKRYVRCNSTDTEIITLLADHYQEMDDAKNAKDYYQRTLNRLLITPDPAKSLEVFSSLLKNGKSEFSFYSTYISKLGSNPVAIEMGKMLIKKLLEEKAAFTSETTPAIVRRNSDNTIEVCKAILSIDPENMETKEMLSSVLKARYGSSSRYGEVSKKYDVVKSHEPVKTLDEFQKNIAYSKNTYVLQNATGKVGIISDVAKDGMLTVKFSNQANDVVRINIANAMVSLTALSNKDIRTIRKALKKDVIRTKIFGEGGYNWLLKTLLFSSSDKTATMKEMKDTVVPSLLTEKEWNTASKELKNAAQEDPYIEIIRNSYHLMDYPSSKEERVYDTFLRTKEFDKRVAIILDASEDSGINIKSDEFLEMARFFSSFVKDSSNLISDRIEALLVVEDLSGNGVPVTSEISFQELYKNLSIQEKKDTYVKLSCKRTKKAYIDLLPTVDKKAFDVLEVIFPTNPTKEMAKKMQSLDEGKFKKYVVKCLSDYINNGTAFGFFVDYGIKLKDYGIKEDEFIINELDALSSLFMYRLRDERQIKILRRDLIEENRLSKYISSAKEDNVVSLSSHLFWNNGISKEEKEAFKAQILSRFPNMKFDEEKKKQVEEKPVEISVQRGFMCTKESFDRMQAELIDIKEVQIPHTLKEISTARELGDLRENSEYQYAKEHKIFLDREYERIANELSSVKIMDKDDVLEGRVGFGTKVVIKDLSNGKEKEYKFFGRWESDPDNNIVDINAPIGQALINSKVGDVVDYSISGNKFSYEVMSIEKIDF